MINVTRTQTIVNTIVVTFLLNLYCMVSFAAEQGTWNLYTNGNFIIDLASYGDYVWCATKGGVVRWDTRDMSSTLYTVMDGLSDNIINCIAVDSTGIVWAGTKNRVCSFDGVQWKQHTSVGGAHQITVSSGNCVYTATGGGIYKYDKGMWNKILKSGWCIGVSSDNSFWVGYEGGVDHHVGTQCISYPLSDYMENTRVRSILVDGDDVWVGSFNGLARFHDGQWSSCNESGVGSLEIKDIEHGPDGAIWFATNISLGSGGLSRFDGTTWQTFHHLINNDIINIFQPITIDKNNVVWGGFVNDGFEALFKFTYQDEQWQHYRQNIDKALIEDDVSSIKQTPNGDLYAASGYGLSYIRDGKFSPAFPAVSDFVYKPLGLSPSGTLYFGKGGEGLFRLSGDEIVPVEGFTGSYVTSIAFEDESTYWVGTSSSSGTIGGLYRYNDGNWTEFHTEDGLPNNRIYDIAVDTDSSVWIGTPSGLARYTNGAWKCYSALELGLIPDPDYQVVSIEAAPSGSVCMCATGTQSGLVTYSGGEFHVTSCTAERELQFDRQGRLWYISNKSIGGGTIRGYFGRYNIDADSVEVEYDIPFFPYMYQILSMLIAQDGTIWLGTFAEGLFSFKPNEGTAVESRDDNPAGFVLVNNYPNPFNPTTTIGYTIPERADVSIAIYNATGQKVRSVDLGMQSPGSHEYVFDGSGLPSGVYLYRVKAGNQERTGRMLLMK
jgi:ligand-binding sensor domain-containing protein